MPDPEVTGADRELDRPRGKPRRALPHGHLVLVPMGRDRLRYRFAHNQLDLACRALRPTRPAGPAAPVAPVAPVAPRGPCGGVDGYCGVSVTLGIPVESVAYVTALADGSRS